MAVMHSDHAAGDLLGGALGYGHGERGRRDGICGAVATMSRSAPGRGVRSRDQMPPG